MVIVEKVEDWSLSLVNRKGNKATDCIADQVMKGMMVPQGWLEKPTSLFI